MVEFKKKVLKNGMTIVFEKRALPVVSVAIANKFGAINETSNFKGVAHFIEHLLFTGTKSRSHEDLSKEIEKKGGILNGFTSQELTAFWFKLPSEHLFAGLEILSDMLNNPMFDEKKFEKEKKVILEEIKMYKDDPASSVMELLEKKLFDKPFGEGVIGSIETISKMKRDSVKDLFEKSYNPSNYIVAVVGDADFDKLCYYFESNFESNDNWVDRIEIKELNGEEVEERQGIDQAHFALGIHAPRAGSPDYYTLRVLDGYLANGMSSRLFLEIREKRGLAYAIKSAVDSDNDYSYYRIYVGTTKENIDEVKKIILDELKKVGKISEKDFKESKERLIGLDKISREESVNVMHGLLCLENLGSVDEFYEFEKNINKVGVEDVRRLAKELSEKEYSSAAIVPK